MHLDPRSSLRTVYCTVSAQNYLPQVVTLYESTKLNDPTVDFVALTVDADEEVISLTAAAPGLIAWTTQALDLEASEIDNLRAIYDVVEYSTAVKPRFFLKLLENYDRVVYLDPDTYALTSLTDLNKIIDSHAVVLTPHFLRPVPNEVAYIADDHTLTTGIHNLGFGAFSRDAEPFLEWWWSKLRRDCLIYPLLGIFVDQKWTDIGASYFGAFSLKDSGYNVGPWNLHERDLHVAADGGIQVMPENLPLRLFHFSGFDPEHPRDLSVRLNADLSSLWDRNEVLEKLSVEYAGKVLAARAKLGILPSYRYSRNSSGRFISTRLRRVYRSELLAANSPPSLFSAGSVRDANRWMRTRTFARWGSLAADVAIAAKYASPDSFRHVRKLLGGNFSSLRKFLLARNRIRG